MIDAAGAKAWALRRQTGFTLFVDAWIEGRLQINFIPTRSMVSIASDRPMTVINVFTVAPEQQARLVELLTRPRVEHSPHSWFRGRCSAPRSDGTKVTMYAQWRTPDDYAQMRARPDSHRFSPKLSLSPGLIRVSTR